jgi:negative regulator of sigma E activity
VEEENAVVQATQESGEQKKVVYAVANKEKDRDDELKQFLRIHRKLSANPL